MTLNLGDNFKLREDGEDLVIEHIPSGGTLEYDDSENAWVPTDPIGTAGRRAANIHTQTMDAQRGVVSQLDNDGQSVTLDDDVDAASNDVSNIGAMSSDSATVTNQIDSGSVSTAQVNGIHRLKNTDGESELRDVVENANYGDKVILPPQYSVTLTSTLTIPPGVMLEGSAREKVGAATLTKGFNGPLVEFNDWVTIKNIHLDGNRQNGYSGDGLVYESSNTRELWFETVAIEKCEGAALAINEFYLSTVIGCHFFSSDVGLRVDGSQHGPHNLWNRCNISLNDNEGIKVNHIMDRNAWVKSYIHSNGGAGIDGTNCSTGKMWNSPFIGTNIQDNDGPGILADDQRIDIHVSPGSIISKNKQNPASSLTTPVGDIHSEGGSVIFGECSGTMGDLYNHGSHSPSQALKIMGMAGTISDSDLRTVVLDSRRVTDYSNTRSTIALETENQKVINENGEKVYGEYGTSTQSGDGTTTDFSVVNGSLTTNIESAQVTPASADANGDFYIEPRDGRIDIFYETAPPSGTDNLSWEWLVKF